MRNRTAILAITLLFGVVPLELIACSKDDVSYGTTDRTAISLTECVLRTESAVEQQLESMLNELSAGSKELREIRKVMPAHDDEQYWFRENQIMLARYLKIQEFYELQIQLWRLRLGKPGADRERCERNIVFYTKWAEAYQPRKIADWFASSKERPMP